MSAQESGKWHTYKVTHFIIYYKNAPEEFINKLSEKAEDYYSLIADNLGFRRFNFWLWENRAKIYIYDDAKDYQVGTAQPSWSSGCALARDKIIKTFPYAQGFFETILPHEMGHIIFREFVGFDNPSVPVWLDEGVASYQEKQKYSFANQIIREALAKGKFMDIANLSKLNLPASVDTEMVGLFYAEAFSIINYLVKEFGTDNFVLFCQGLRDKRDLERALFYAYPFRTVQELDKAWQKYLTDR